MKAAEGQMGKHAGQTSSPIQVGAEAPLLFFLCPFLCGKPVEWA